MAISAEQLVSILGDALSRRPTDFYSDAAMDWFADVAGAVMAYSSPKGMLLNALLTEISNVGGGALSPVTATRRQKACVEFITRTRAIYAEVRLYTNAFQTAQIDRGEVFDYFQEVRGLILGATTDLLFIDPYINADFAQRYLPQVQTAVRVRLLTDIAQAAALAPALALFRSQHALNVEARTLPSRSIHDRHLVVDRRDVYQSGASFKDGGRNAPTTINQIVDVAGELIAAHESRWASAQVIQ